MTLQITLLAPNEIMTLFQVLMCNSGVLVLRYVWGLRSTASFVLHSAEGNRGTSSNGFVTSQVISPRAFGLLDFVPEWIFH
jgi:hypothetical protein